MLGGLSIRPAKGKDETRYHCLRQIWQIPLSEIVRKVKMKLGIIACARYGKYPYPKSFER
jgi:hypothetical protein